MTTQDFIAFFKTKSGRLLTFVALFAGGALIFNAYRSRQEAAENPVKATPAATNNITDKPQVVQTVQRPMEAFHPPAPKPEPPVQSSRSKTTAITSTNSAGQSAVMLAPISLVADNTTDEPKQRSLSSIYAPYGRLIPCETIVTVDSASIQTPIIGLITENIYHAGKLVIPAGTEVHGTAQTDHQRERIAGGNSWTLVWQNGQEMQIKALALDREFDRGTNQVGWGITDGSAGLRGRLIKSDDLAEIKLFAATFLSGATEALTEKETTLFGTINSPSLNNAPLEGAQEVLKVYAQRILESIQKDGFYVRVPSGKQFYLYVIQTIDLADAMLGGTRARSIPPVGDSH